MYFVISLENAIKEVFCSLYNLCFNVVPSKLNSNLFNVLSWSLSLVNINLYSPLVVLFSAIVLKVKVTLLPGSTLTSKEFPE